MNEAAYDFNTGLVLNAKDENNQQTDFIYDATTLRRTRVDAPNGAWSTVEYNDTVFPYSIKSTSSLDATRSISSWSFFNGAGQGFRSRSQTASGYISSDVEFDIMGRAVKSFNPYTVSRLTDPRPSGIKFTEAVQFDALGRTLLTKLPDDTTVQSSYNGLMATLTDQAGIVVGATYNAQVDTSSFANAARSLGRGSWGFGGMTPGVSGSFVYVDRVNFGCYLP